MVSLRLLPKLCMGVLVASYAATSMYAAPPVVMKVLVLAGTTSENSYQSITTYLNQVGVPYQSTALKSITPDSSGNRMSKVSLTDSAAGRGLYQGIILTDSTFSACSPSCMSSADWTTLNNYAAQYSVRVASYYTSPQAQWGLLPVDSGVGYSGTNPLNASLTTAGSMIFSYLNSANSIPVGGQGTGTIKAFRATTTAATGETTTPLLTSGIYTLAATHTTTDGREILALTMDNSPTLIHSVAFGYGVINWVTRGIFLGSRKVYLNPQVDDLLLGNWLYSPQSHPSCESNGTCPTYFMSGPELQAHAQWQATLQSDPQFQSYRGTFAYNGVGTTWFSASDPVFAAIKSLNSNFWWLSHTWDHANLDCYSTNAAGNCVGATMAQSTSELSQNINVASTLGITLDRTSMVTPFNGGLTNANFMNAAVQAGLQYIVTAEIPDSANTGIVDTVNSNIYLIPRVKSVFDDASTALTGVPGSYTDEYNAIYGPNGTEPIYSQNQNYSQIVDNVSNSLLINNVLAYEPYLLAFHIANLSLYDGTHSLFTDVLGAVISKYKKLYSLPVMTVDMKDLAPVLKARSSFNASGVVGVYTPGVSVVLTSTRAASIPVTGICSQASCGTYGGQIQDFVTMAANSTVTLPITSVEGATLSSFILNPTSTTGGASVTGSVALSGGAPSGGATISLASNNGSATVPASVTVAAGASTGSFTITTGSVSSPTNATISASYGGLSKTAALTITPGLSVALSSVAVSPASVSGGSSAIGTVALSGVAPSGGITVRLSSASSSATVPASVAISAGTSSASFVISTSAVNSTVNVTITASDTTVSKSANLSVTPVATAAALSSVSVAPTSVAGGTAAIGTVTLSGSAPSGGTVVALSSNSTLATMPASITVPAGSTSATFSVNTSPIGSTRVATITASLNALSKTASLTINPSGSVSVVSVSVNPASVTSETTTTGTVTISTPAPVGGIGIELWTTGTVAFVPAEVIIPAGSTTATFAVNTNYTTATLHDTITAFYNGVSKTAALTVLP